jgi:hypothetical protein
MPLSFNSELYLKFRSTNALCFVKNPAASGGALKPRTTPTADAHLIGAHQDRLQNGTLNHPSGLPIIRYDVSESVSNAARRMSSPRDFDRPLCMAV